MLKGCVLHEDKKNLVGQDLEVAEGCHVLLWCMA